MKRKQKPESKLTLGRMREIARKAGARVTVSLVPNEPPANASVVTGYSASTSFKYPLPTVPPEVLDSTKWPGNPTCRSIMAHDASDEQIAKEFKASPSSKWIVTATRIVERTEFFKKLATTTPTTGNPS